MLYCTYGTFGSLPYVYDDGGRAGAGYRGDAGDCVVRAIAIATAQPYQQVYDTLAELEGRSVRDGASPKVYRPYLENLLGWTWTPTMRIRLGHHRPPAPGRAPRRTAHRPALGASLGRDRRRHPRHPRPRPRRHPRGLRLLARPRAEGDGGPAFGD